MTFMVDKLLGFVMVLTRISAFFLVLPVFSWQSIPVRIKVGLAVLLAVFFSVITPLTVEAKRVSLAGAIFLICNEAAYGLALGLIAAVVFSAVNFSGQIVEREMGLALAEVLDPLTGESSQPMGSLLEMIFILLFLSANGHHLLLLIISKSYEAFPSGRIPTVAVLTAGVSAWPHKKSV